jgi:excisionase family DNA binding protein
LPDEDYITVAKASRLAGLSRRQLTRLLSEGKIRGLKPARDWLVHLSAVMEYVKQERKPGPKKGSKTP